MEKSIPEVISSYLKTLIPSTILDEITSFCFISEYPKWIRRPDIVVTTNRGELLEIKQRKIVRSCLIDHGFCANNLRLFFNKTSGKYADYLIGDKDRFFVVGAEKEDLKIISKYSNVTKWEVNDLCASGDVRIMLWCFDSTIPMVLNDLYEIDTEDGFIRDEGGKGEDDQIVSILSCKLSEARLNTANNRKMLDERKKLRQKISHLTGEDTRFNLDEVKNDKGINIFDKIRVGSIWQRIYDERWIIGIPVQNISSRFITDVDIILQFNDKEIFHYNTSIYIQDDNDLILWKKLTDNILESTKSYTILIITNLPAFDEAAVKVLKCALSYKYENKIHCMPLEQIILKSIEVINGSLDIIFHINNKLGLKEILSLEAANLKEKFNVYFLSPKKENIIPILTDKFGYIRDLNGISSFLYHTKSPAHVLHGSLIYIREENIENNVLIEMTVFSRSEQQLLMLINTLYDLFPSRIAIVPLCYSIENETENSMEIENSMEMNKEMKNKILNYNNALGEQISLVGTYLEECINAMSTSGSTNLNTNNDTSIQINLLSMGYDKYKEFWNNYHKLANERKTFLKEYLLEK